MRVWLYLQKSILQSKICFCEIFSWSIKLNHIYYINRPRPRRGRLKLSYLKAKLLSLNIMKWCRVLIVPFVFSWDFPDIFWKENNKLMFILPFPIRGSLEESQIAELISNIIFMYLKMYLKMYLILRILGLLWKFRLKWSKNQDFWSIFAHNSY